MLFLFFQWHRYISHVIYSCGWFGEMKLGVVQVFLSFEIFKFILEFLDSGFDIQRCLLWARHGFFQTLPNDFIIYRNLKNTLFLPSHPSLPPSFIPFSLPPGLFLYLPFHLVYTKKSLIAYLSAFLNADLKKSKLQVYQFLCQSVTSFSHISSFYILSLY